MINWFKKIKDKDYEFINNIINSDEIKFLDYPNIANNNNLVISSDNINNLKNINNNSNIILNINNVFIENIDTFGKIIISLKKKLGIDFNKLNFFFCINPNLDTTFETIAKVCNIYNLIIALKKETKKEIYEYIYDVTCDYLDYMFVKNNYCDFKNDTCVANRKHTTCHKDFGCCYNIQIDKFLNLKNNGICPYQQNRQCQIKCLSCKLFTCKYYRKQGIKFTPENVFLLKHLFNKKQKLILKYNIYHDKNEIIDKLLEKNNMPYYMYYLTKSYYINN